MTFNPEFAKGILRFQKITPSADRGYVIYAGDLSPELANASVLNFSDVDTLF